ncbi:MAG: carbamoyltransferase HypF [Spirochaetota bacterium]
MIHHYHIRVKGIVQGVGFRPFVYNLAVAHNLYGSVSNDTEGVSIHLEGPEKDIHQCIDSILNNPPPLAQITSITIKKLSPDGLTNFTIQESTTTNLKDAFIPPDVAICNECLNDFFDVHNRRYHYPFTTCTHCGPRFSIIEDIPYDRKNTAMKPFSMCTQCLKEYTNPQDRRFHTQPNACWQCGPHIILCDSSGNVIQTQFDAVISQVKDILKHHIVALKSVGGYHLACDATNDYCVQLLRQRKGRPFKPFAIMVSSIEFLETFCLVSSKEKELLQSKERPIVLVRLQKNILSQYVAPGLAYLGVMLPYTPFQYMLFANNGDSIYIMTSANISDEPIIYQDDDAFERLKYIADYFVTYNREIISHTDDSVMQVVDEKPFFIRRSRGFVPTPLFLKKSPIHILATGGDLKNSFALARDNVVIVSQYLGDISTPWGNDLYRKTITHYSKIFDCTPALVVHDLHPNYFTTMFANELHVKGIPTLATQHHHAHIVSVCEEHSFFEPVIGIAYDGTGYGPDHTLWGSELLIADVKEFIRVAHFDYFALPGGENAIKDPWKIGLSLLLSSGIETTSFYTDKKEKESVEEIIKKNLNSPLTCSIGRLFDGVASLLGIVHHISTEAEAAMLLEEEALKEYSDSPSSLLISIHDADTFIVNTAQLIQEIVTMLSMKIPTPTIAIRFHKAIVQITVDLAVQLRDKYNINTVALAGGVFHNRILLHLITQGLQKKSFDIILPKKLPCNDGGIALGQITIGRENYNA